MRFELEQALEILVRTPGTLRALLSGLGEHWARANYGPQTFSPFDVVGHLIHAEKTNWMTRARVILEHGAARPFGPFDRYAMYETSRGKALAELLDEFEHLRAENVRALRGLNLTPERLALRGTHPELGTVTLAQLLATWVVHDLNHVAQICKALAWQYADAVGPWRAYLSILPRPQAPSAAPPPTDV